MLTIGLMMRIVKRVSNVIGPSSRTRGDLSRVVVVVVALESGVDVVVKVEEMAEVVGIAFVTGAVAAAAVDVVGVARVYGRLVMEAGLSASGSECVEVIAVTTAGWSASLIGAFVVPF